MSSERVQLALALKQVELIKQFGARPDTWLCNSNEHVWQPGQPDKKMNVEDAESIVEKLGLPCMFLIPDNER